MHITIHLGTHFPRAILLAFLVISTPPAIKPRTSSRLFPPTLSAEDTNCKPCARSVLDTA
nr:MAG TPA: hypothetical protein [Caudoviricetes sp.]